MWFCHSSHQEVGSVFPLHESGLASSLALSKRMWEKWWCVSSKAIQLWFSAFWSLSTIMWGIPAWQSLFEQKAQVSNCPSPVPPPANLPALQRHQKKSAHLPSHPTEYWEIRNCGYFKPWNLGVVCYTAIDNWALYMSDFIQRSGWYICLRVCVQISDHG